MDALESLRAWRNADGGWGYTPGKRSRLEPTCLACLAFGVALPAPSATSLLAAWPSREGLLLDGADLDVNHAFNGLALMTLVSAGAGAGPRAAGIASRLLALKGVPLPNSGRIAQDSTLQAWSWVDGTFSWVEPTGWCLLGLKKWRVGRSDPRLATRLREAEQLLFDRACEAGGWNYGNPRVLGTALHPYVTTTAIGALALQDRSDHPVVRKAVAALARDAATEPSALSFALSGIALYVMGRPAGVVLDSLPLRVATAIELGQVAGVALAAYALAGQEGGYAEFRI